MANLIQATVYQIDGSPLPSPITLDFQTSDILLREVTINISAVNTAIQFYNVPNNQLGIKTYYVAETVSSLTASANAGFVTLTQATVLEINGDPQPPGGLQYSFPSQEVTISPAVNPTTGVNAIVTFKGSAYSVSETEATLLANSNDLSGVVLNEQGVPAFYADTLANIPTPGEPGRMFVSTDTYAFYRDTGAAWDLIGGPGSGTVTGSGATGQVSFWNGTSVIAGNSNLFWDSANNRLGLGTSSPAQQLDLTGSARIQTIANATINTDRFLVSDAGVIKYRTGAQVLSDIGAPAGTGTTNYLVKWTGTTALGNSTVFDDGTKVGIGTTTPTLGSTGAGLSIVNSSYTQLRVQSSGSSAGIEFNATTGRLYELQSAPAGNSFFLYDRSVSAYRWTMFGTGNFLIGPGTTDNGYRLDVEGGNFRVQNGSSSWNLLGNTTIQNLKMGSGTSTFTGIDAGAARFVSGNVRMSVDSSWTNFLYNISNENFYFGRSQGPVASYKVDIEGTLRSTADTYFATASGSVGVGTTSPQAGYRFTSNGGIYTTAGSVFFDNLDITNSGYSLRADIYQNTNLAQRFQTAVTGVTLNGFGLYNTTFEAYRNLASYSASFTVGTRGVTASNANPTYSFGINPTFGVGNGYFGGITAWNGTAVQNLITFFPSTFNVGIGLSSQTDAGYKLDVNGTANINGTVTFGGTGTGQGTLAKSGTESHFTSSGAIFIRAAASQKVVLASGGGGYRMHLTTTGQWLFGGGSGETLSGIDNNSGQGVLRLLYSTAANSQTEGARLFTSGNFGIGTTTDETSAILNVSSTTKGFLPPRMTGAQAEAIATPADGLMIYANNGNGTTITSVGFWGYAAGAWVKLN